MIRLNARQAVVQVEGAEKPLKAAFRKSLWHGLTGFTKPVVVGDRVVLTRFGPKEAVVEEVLPRRGYLSRRAIDSQLEQVICANVEQVLVVASIMEPIVNPRLIDRILVAAERGGFQPIVAFTKVDLLPDGERGPFEELREVYADLGYRALFVGNPTGEGIDELRDALKDRTTVLAGPSGAGKSSTLNALQPGLGLEVKTVSEKWGKGRHTTTAVSLFPLAFGGYVVDTPGVRSFGIAGLEPSDVAIFMPDLAAFVPACHHSDCTHVHEPRCAVKDAVEEGRIHPERYDSYLRIIAGVEEDAAEGI